MRPAGSAFIPSVYRHKGSCLGWGLRSLSRTPWFCHILKTSWWMNVIVEIVFQCDTTMTWNGICRSVTYISWSSDFALYMYILKTVWWSHVIIGISIPCDTKTYLIKCMWSSNSVLHLEDYLIDKCHNWDIGSMQCHDLRNKMYVCQWPTFHGPVILSLSWRLFDEWMLYWGYWFSVGRLWRNQWPIFQWFCLLFDEQASFFGYWFSLTKIGLMKYIWVIDLYFMI